MKVRNLLKKGDVRNCLTALSDPYKRQGSREYFVDTQCTCGKHKTVYEYHMRTGQVKSCGHLRDENTRKLNFQHGLDGTPEHISWKNMIQRCTNHNKPDYVNYGGRGITVCGRWLEPNGRGFLNFLEDMGKKDGKQEIDRIDVNGNYEPSNCRWECSSVQTHNRRKTKSIKGKKPTSEYLGVSYDGRSNKWICKIGREGKVIVKLFNNEVDAAKAYDDLSFIIYGDKPNETKLQERELCRKLTE